MEGIGRCLMKGTIPAFLEGLRTITGKANHDGGGGEVSGPRFEPGISTVRSTSDNHAASNL
jgi:hypothetical protein